MKNDMSRLHIVDEETEEIHNTGDVFYDFYKKNIPHDIIQKHLVFRDYLEKVERWKFIHEKTNQHFFYTLELHKTAIQKILHITDDIAVLLEDTKASLDDIRLPYNNFFVNHKFCYKGHIFAGIAVADGRIASFAFEESSKEEINMNCPIADIAQYDGKLLRYIHKIISNLVNLINNQSHNVDFVNVKPDNNEKRIKRGKTPIPNYTQIRLNGDLKRYAEHYRQNRTTSNIRYQVRGHWRSFKSERYVNKLNDKTWIYPYIKGDKDAPMIPKEVRIIK